MLCWLLLRIREILYGSVLVLRQRGFDEYAILSYSEDTTHTEECPDMPKKKYVVDLSAEERATLEHLLRGGKTGARKLTRARILLKAAAGLEAAPA